MLLSVCTAILVAAALCGCAAEHVDDDGTRGNTVMTSCVWHVCVWTGVEGEGRARDVRSWLPGGYWFKN